MTQQLSHLAEKLGRIEAPAAKPSAKASSSGDEKPGDSAGPKDADSVAAELDRMDKQDE